MKFFDAIRSTRGERPIDPPRSDAHAERDEAEITNTFSFVDTEGKSVCKVLIEAEPKKDLGLGISGRRIKKWVLSVRNNAQQDVEVDLVTFFQEISGCDIPIFIAENTSDGPDEAKIGIAKQVSKTKVTFLNPELHEPEGLVLVSKKRLKESFMMFATAHEFGHAAQQRQPEYAQYEPLYKLHKQPKHPGYLNVLASTGRLMALADLIPKSEEQRMRGVLSEYCDLTYRITKAEERLAYLDSSFGEEVDRLALYRKCDVSDQELSIVRERIEAMSDEKRELLEQIPKFHQKKADLRKEIEPYLELPTQILERNATARALLYVRALYERYGVDFVALYATIDWKVGSTPQGSCLSSILSAIKGPGGATSIPTEDALYQNIDYVHKNMDRSDTPGMHKKYGSIRSPGLETTLGE
jgi:hypothetical protein